MKLFVLSLFVIGFVSSADRVLPCLNIYGESTELVFLDDIYPYYKAQSLCESRGASLVNFETSAYYDAVRGQVNSIIGSNEAWMGLRRPSLIESFEYTDGLGGSKDFFLSLGEGPWESNQPNEPDVECVAWFFKSSTSSWFDQSCETEIRTICRRSCSNSYPDSSVSDCFFNDFEVVLLNNIYTFAGAEQACEEVGGTVARIQSLDEFLRVEDFIFGLGITNENLFIGLKRPFRYYQDDPTLYKRADGKEADTFFYEERGIYPWDSYQPTYDSITEECVYWDSYYTHSWHNGDCTPNKRVFCQRECTSKEDVTTIEDKASESNNKSSLLVVGGVFGGFIILTVGIIVGVMKQKKKSTKEEVPVPERKESL